MTLKKKPSAINATRELADFIHSLDKECYLEKVITKAKEKLSDNMFSGARVQKKLIPRYYVRSYDLDNLYVLDLDSSRRLSYTLLYNGTGVVVILIEIFLSHKNYEQRFGYA